MKELARFIKMESVKNSSPESLVDLLDKQEKEITDLKDRVKELEKFKEEQSQISCAYCGALCARDTEELIKHIESCEKHPVFKLINKIAKRDGLISKAKPFVEGYELSTEESDSEDASNWIKEVEALKVEV